MAKNMVLTYLHLLDPGIPIESTDLLVITMLPYDTDIIPYRTTDILWKTSTDLLGKDGEFP